MMYLTKYGEVPKRLKGLASNTSRSETAQGFKSLLLRLALKASKNNRKKLKKVVDICEGWCYYNQVAAIRQRQKLKETLMNTGFFKN